MAINIEHRWCYRCQASVKSERHSVTHLFHFFMSVATLGLWIPVWIVLANLREFKCSACGSAAAKLPLGGRTARDADEFRENRLKQDNRNALLIVGSLIVIPILVLVCDPGSTRKLEQVTQERARAEAAARE